MRILGRRSIICRNGSLIYEFDVFLVILNEQGLRSNRIILFAAHLWPGATPGGFFVARKLESIASHILGGGIMGDSGAPVGGLVADGADIAGAKSSRGWRWGGPCRGAASLEPDGDAVVSVGRVSFSNGGGGEQNNQQATAAETPPPTTMAAAEPRLSKKRRASPEAPAEPRLNKFSGPTKPQLPDGPGNLREVLTVLMPAITKVVERARAAGLILSDRLAGKDWDVVLIITSCSGTCCAETAIRIVRQHVLEHGIGAKETKFSATDINAACRKALPGHKAESASQQETV